MLILKIQKIKLWNKYFFFNRTRSASISLKTKKGRYKTVPVIVKKMSNSTSRLYIYV